MSDLEQPVFSLGTLPKSHNGAQVFLRSNEGSIFNKVYKHHMSTEDSFVPFMKGIELLVGREKYAYYEGYQYFYSVPGYECKVATNLF